jgi:hypothetical protein
MTTTTESRELTTTDLASAGSKTDNQALETANRQEMGTRGFEERYTGPLLPNDFSEDMRSRWESIQAGFVDDPRVAVQRADELVASAIKKLAESFAGERGKLEQQWSTGNDVSTEDLRQALRRYRAFFHRLLSI